MKTAIKKLDRILIAILIASTIGGLGGLIPQSNFLIDLLTNLWPFYFVSLLILVLYFSIFRPSRWRYVALVGAAVLLFILESSSSLRTKNQFMVAPKNQILGGSKIMFFNAERGNRVPELTWNYLKQSQINTVVFFEATPVWKSQLEKLALSENGSNLFQHSASFVRTDYHGVLVWSRTPLFDVKVHSYGYSELPTVSFVLGEGSTSVRVLGTHLLAPMSPVYFAARNEMLEELVEWVKSYESSMPLILGGDFNLTPHSLYYRKFIKDSGLEPLRCQGFELTGTWPTWLPLVRLRLDHVFASRELGEVQCVRGEHLGSDHFPLVVSQQRVF